MLLVLLGMLTLVGTSQSSGGQTRVLGVQYTAPSTTAPEGTTGSTTAPEIPFVPTDVATTEPAPSEASDSSAASVDAPAPAPTTATASVPAPATTTTTGRTAPGRVVETSDNQIFFSYQQQASGPAGSATGGKAGDPFTFHAIAQQVGNVVRVHVYLKNASGSRIVFPDDGLRVRFVYGRQGEEPRVLEITDGTVTDLAHGDALELDKDFTPPAYGTYNGAATVEVEYQG